MTQQDHLMPYLTVKETLLYTAKLRLKQGPATDEVLTASDVESAVDKVISELGLKECASTQIGDAHASAVGGRRGVSGGEKRRVSVALQVLTDPEVIFVI